jgi:hypothetical protein
MMVLSHTHTHTHSPPTHPQNNTKNSPKICPSIPRSPRRQDHRCPPHRQLLLSPHKCPPRARIRKSIRTLQIGARERSFGSVEPEWT